MMSINGKSKKLQGEDRSQLQDKGHVQKKHSDQDIKNCFEAISQYVTDKLGFGMNKKKIG